MPATPITDPIQGESLVGTEPQLQQQIDPGYWRQRLNLFTGRTLSVSALDNEQSYRGGLLATMGQAVTAGTVTGFALTLDPAGADPTIAVTPGYGIMANGQDVALNTTLKAKLSTLTVVDAVTGTDLFTFHQLVGDPTNNTYAGILLLQPVIAQVSGQQLDSGNLPTVVSGNLNASCGQDPAEYAFEDWQIADAVRLVYLPWPAGVPNLALPPAEPLATWRNRLAYAIFEAESLLGPDDQMPWASIGLPVALIAFDPGTAWQGDTGFSAGQFLTDGNGNIRTVQTAGTTATEQQKWNTTWGGLTTDGSVTWVNSGLAWKPLFVDCNAVVRAGGLPRKRSVLPAEAAPVVQWQPLRTYAADDYIIDSYGYVQKVQTAGASGGVPPQWNAQLGKTTNDGTVAWINNGLATWQPNTAYAVGQFVFDSNNNQQHVQVEGTSGKTEPDWNGVYLPTADGTVSWINNGSGNPPIVQPSLAQARINQLSEQLSQMLATQPQVGNFADVFTTMPPSGIVPAAALNFTDQTAPWFPPNWSLSAAPVHFEELETALETGMLMSPIAAESSAPDDGNALEPVEILVPLPDAVYDPNILVVETVPQEFYDERNKATAERNLTLQKLYTVKQELNTLFAAIGPNVPANPNLINPNADLTADELTGRNTPPPYTPAADETFATVLQSTWEPSSAYSAGQFVIDSNGAIQVAQTTGKTSAVAPDWDTTIGETTSDGVTWICRGNSAWQSNTQYAAGTMVLDPSGNIEVALAGGTSGAEPIFNAAVSTDNAVTWVAQGAVRWQPSTAYAVNQYILDSTNNIQRANTAGTSGTTEPTWNLTAGQTTKDVGVVWVSCGRATWQPNQTYVGGAVIIDSNGNIQALTGAAGTSGILPPAWANTTGSSTVDGLAWSNLGKNGWQASAAYAAGAAIVDPQGFIQLAATGGVSGANQPAWNDTAGATTADAAVIWLNNGPWAWQPDTVYVNGQFVIDPQGFMQQVTTGGISASSQPAWLQAESIGATLADGSVTWKAAGKQYWQPNHAYAGGSAIIDANGNIQISFNGGTSGAAMPTWDPNLQQETRDNTVVWNNLGHAAWAPNTTFNGRQAILDALGSVQLVQAAGTSGATVPEWHATETAGQVTLDGIVWQSGGNAVWKADFLYAAGQLIFDERGNIQIVQTGGISSDTVPAWNPNSGQTTQDSAVVWQNLGRSRWLPNTSYTVGEAVVDATGNIQSATIGGTSGAVEPQWTEGTDSTTTDTSVKWTNQGPLTWQKQANYSAGQIIVDANGNLQFATILLPSGALQPIGTQGQSGATTPAWNTEPAGTTTDNQITWRYLAYLSTDLQQLEFVASQAPYTISYTDSTGTTHEIKLLSQSDFTNLETNGLQALITSLNHRIARANDLLDTGFLTAQTDIYRFRNYVLGASAATALATSPVLATIAKGETAAATASDLRSYIDTVIPPPGPTTTSSSQSNAGQSQGTTTTTTTTTTGSLPPIYHPPILSPIKIPVILANNPISTTTRKLMVATTPMVANLRARTVAASIATQNISLASTQIDVNTFRPTINPTLINTAQNTNIGSTLSNLDVAGLKEVASGISQGTSAINASTLVGRQIDPGIFTTVGGPAKVVSTTQTPTPTQTDITSQSPLSGAQLNIRTLTIAQRLEQSPSQEALFYAISNRLSFLSALEALESDLNLVVDDLPILMDNLPATPPTIPGGTPATTRNFSEWKGVYSAAIEQQLQSPYLVSDASEATLFSVGVRVVEQHTMMLRALEARVQQYSDFVTLCTNALNNMRSNIRQGQSYIAQLTNTLHQDRQNVAFTSALLQDEIQQVQSTNAQRQQVLASAVQLVAYTRARTLNAIDTAPSRQLVPANITNPVPACLQQSVAIPAEIREIVGQLREAPVSWLPAVNAQIANLERPTLLQQLAFSAQTRALQLMQMPSFPSSAAGEKGSYATSIAAVYNANQTTFRDYVAQRATVSTAALPYLSWTQQVSAVQNLAAVNDLISAEAVHAEISNAVARTVQQISTVATCLYTRVSIAQPIDRLNWADYLTGDGSSVQLRSLAVLPGWNGLDYTSRQQMQMLVDWLFLQIDTSISAATAFMSDVVRTAILTASDVPIDNIIAGGIIARVQPAVGIDVRLTLPSERIASGMYVNLYSGATLAARGVVSDIDSSSVKATVTDVYSPGTYIETTDTAHFTTLAPTALAIRPLLM